MQIRMRGDHHQSPDSLFQFHMDTRITKLLGLLASNSTVISEQTAQSLAESVQNVADFLNQLEPYLLDKNWSTRVAAAKVLKCLSGRPQIIENQNNLQSDDFIVVGLPHLLHQSVAFNLEEQLKLEALLASSGDEYQKTTTEPLESKLTMWSTIDKQVGMDAKLLGLSSREWLTDEDVKTEENFDRSSPASIGESTSKRIKLEEDRVDFKPVEDVSEREANIRQFMEKWVYGKFMLKLQTNRLLFSPLWYERHGCLLGLMVLKFILIFDDQSIIYAFQELVKMLLKLAKTDINQSSLDQVLMVVINSLLRLAVRDRFSDFVGSQIVVPVRETIAQVFLLVHSFGMLSLVLNSFLYRL